MPKLRFDPLTYQFYYRCLPEDCGPAKAAGFSWDALRRRYYTAEPKVAAILASRGDDYVRLLLADALGADHRHEPTAARSESWTVPTWNVAASSNTIH